MSMAEILYIVGGVGSAMLATGWHLAHIQEEYGNQRRHYRTDLGFSVFWSIGVAVLWPVLIVVAYCLTGFAEHGWRLRYVPRTKVQEYGR